MKNVIHISVAVIICDRFKVFGNSLFLGPEQEQLKYKRTFTTPHTIKTVVL